MPESEFEPGAPHEPVEAGYDALFFDGRSLAEQHVRVRVRAASLRIVDEAGLARRWGDTGLHCDAMQEGGVLHVTHSSAPGEMLVVRNRALEAQVLAIAKQVQRLPGGQRKLQLALLWAAALIALAIALYTSLPVLTHAVAVRIPLEKERMIGAQIEPFIDYLSCTDSKAQLALDKLERELVPAGEPLSKVRLMRNDVPNAFALPGGLVFVTTGLLHQAQSEAEVAGVMAHELEHVSQRHVLSAFLRDAMLTGIWAVTMGDYSGMMVVDPSTAYRIANLKFSRADEQAADDGAVRRLQQAGLSARGMIEFFTRVTKKYGDAPEWLSTHPNSAQRIEALREAAEPKQARTILSDEEFIALRGACEVQGKQPPGKNRGKR